MPRVRNRLLVSLVLVTVWIAAGYSRAHATSIIGVSDGSGGYTQTDPMKPSIDPTTGEPDVGQSGGVHPSTTKSALQPSVWPDGGGVRVTNWFRLASKIWMARYLRMGI